MRWWNRPDTLRLTGYLIAVGALFAGPAFAQGADPVKPEKAPTTPIAAPEGIAAEVVPLAVPVAVAPKKLPSTAKHPPRSTADHTRFAILQQDFATGPDVTKACLSCHTEAAAHVMKTTHWTWRKKVPGNNPGDPERDIGKGAGVINNFCISVQGNEPRCTSCHAGYGYKDKTFDFKDETRVDCLVCHEQTGTYKKFPTGAGHPVYKSEYPNGREWPKKSGKFRKPADLSKIAQSVALPTRANCGTCHFNGGGGEAVKHGDMDKSLLKAENGIDVHMRADGPNFSCTECHTTKQHDVAGRYYTIPGMEDREHKIPTQQKNFLACESCHTDAPHQDSKLNDHTDMVSCEACHIPRMSRQRYTKMWWDWSTAGKMNEKGKPFGKKNPKTGKLDYHSKKGDFIYATNHEPEYIWYDGNMKHLYLGDKIDDKTPFQDKTNHTHGDWDRTDPSKPVVEINWTNAKHGSKNARIYPVKIHRGKQPYDTVNKTMISPKLFPSGKNKKMAFWKSYSWEKANKAGMEGNKLAYSGKFDFIQTQMLWPLKHQVAPAEDAVGCQDCHKTDGRLANLTGFYMPGRDKSAFFDGLGLAMMLGGLLFGLLHGLLRMTSKGGKS